MNNLESVFAAVAIAAPIAIALVSLLKQQGMADRLAPVASVAAGVVVVVLLMLADAIAITLGQSALTGLLSGLTASGTYSGAKAIAKG
jgi:hypothetical protein